MSPLQGPIGAVAGGGGGLHGRSPVDVFADAAARSTYFTTTDTTAYRSFASDRSLFIIIGTLASPTFMTYTGSAAAAYDDTAWVNRVDAVQGPRGTDGDDGAPGGGAIVQMGVVGYDSISASEDDIWLDAGFDWDFDSPVFFYLRSDTAPDGGTSEGRLFGLNGPYIESLTNGTIGAATTGAQRVALQDVSLGGEIRVGKNSANRFLVEFTQTHSARVEFTFYKYVTAEVQGRTDAEIQALIDATPLSNLQGQLTDGQIPAAIMRDAEFTAAAVRNLLGLTATEVNDLFTGATISGQVITITQNDGSTVELTIPEGTGTGMADGVVDGGSISSDGTTLTLTLSEGDDITIDIPSVLRTGTGLDTRLANLVDDLSDAERRAVSAKVGPAIIVESLPATFTADDVGKRYQLQDTGEQFVIEEHVVPGENREVPYHRYTVADNSNYLGEIFSVYDIGPWIRNNNVGRFGYAQYANTWYRITAGPSYTETTQFPAGTLLRTTPFDTIEQALAAVTASGQIFIAGSPAAARRLYIVESGFVAGTTGTTVREAVPTDANHHDEIKLDIDLQNVDDSLSRLEKERFLELSGAWEFIHDESGIVTVGFIPSTNVGELIFLAHDFAVGTATDPVVTAGAFDDRVGWSNGNILEAFGSIAATGGHRAVIAIYGDPGEAVFSDEGVYMSGSYTISNVMVTSQHLAENVDRVEIDGTLYEVDLQRFYGLYQLEIQEDNNGNFPTISSATFSFNLRLSGSGHFYYGDGTTRTETAGLYEWDETNSEYVELATAHPEATQAEAEAGTGTDPRSWPPVRIAQAIAALAAGFKTEVVGEISSSITTHATNWVGTGITLPDHQEGRWIVWHLADGEWHFAQTAAYNGHTAGVAGQAVTQAQVFEQFFDYVGDSAVFRRVEFGVDTDLQLLIRTTATATTVGQTATIESLEVITFDEAEDSGGAMGQEGVAQTGNDFVTVRAYLQTDADPVSDPLFRWRWDDGWSESPDWYFNEDDARAAWTGSADAPVYVAVTSTRRHVSSGGTVTYTDYDWLVTALFDARYSTDGGATWNDTSSDADTHTRFRLPGGEWSSPIPIVDQSPGWELLQDQFQAYSTGGVVRRQFDPSLDFSVMDEVEFEITPFSYAGQGRSPALIAKVRRPLGGWAPSDDNSNFGDDNTVASDYQFTYTHDVAGRGQLDVYRLGDFHDNLGSQPSDVETDYDIDGTSRRFYESLAFKMRLQSSSANENDIDRIIFHDHNATYNRFFFRMWGRRRPS